MTPPIETGMLEGTGAEQSGSTRDASKEVGLTIEPERQRAERTVGSELGKIDGGQEGRDIGALRSRERGALRSLSAQSALRS